MDTSDDDQAWVDVALIGGPMDGTLQPMQRGPSTRTRTPAPT
ncbi:hypothetical protein ACFQXA_38695 [Nocardiopsis composta]